MAKGLHPWNPRGLALALERRQTQVFSYPGGVTVQILPADVSRIAFWVFGTGGSLALGIRPFPTPTDAGVLPLDGQTHVEITSQDWPLLCQQEWYYGTGLAVAGDLVIVQVFRK